MLKAFEYIFSGIMIQGSQNKMVTLHSVYGYLLNLGKSNLTCKLASKT